jgi:hypothetical protein
LDAKGPRTLERPCFFALCKTITQVSMLNNLTLPERTAP